MFGQSDVSGKFARLSLIAGLFLLSQPVQGETNDGKWEEVQSAFQQADYFKALTHLRALEKQTPDESRLHWALATVLEQLGAYEEARINLRRHYELIGRLNDAGYVSHDMRLKRSTDALADVRPAIHRQLDGFDSLTTNNPAQAVEELHLVAQKLGILEPERLSQLYLQLQLVGEGKKAVEYARLDLLMRSESTRQRSAKQRLQQCESDLVRLQQVEQRIAIAGGNYKVGTTGKEWRSNGKREMDRDERPAKKVKLSAFRIASLEVTVAEYRACQLNFGCPAPRLALSYQSALQPVAGISWEGAALYCKSRGGRLPTESEWEVAARGVERRVYPWGEEEADCEWAHHKGCVTVVDGLRYQGGTTPVGTHELGATPEGLNDMAGNVAEWVFDNYRKDGYESLAKEDPTGPERSKRRVTRGGGFDRGSGELRAARREGREPSAGYADVGFRCVWPGHGEADEG